MNIHEYTGLPYDFRRRNCWHHVCDVRSSAGLITPLFDVISPAYVQEAFAEGHNSSKGLIQVYTPENFDAVLMGARMGGRIVWHAGVYFDGFVSHCDAAAKQVKLEAFRDIQERYKEIEFWR